MINVFEPKASALPAIYSREGAPEQYHGHPFIEALDLFKSERTLVELMTREFSVFAEDRTSSRSTRMHLLRANTTTYVPLQRDLDLWSTLLSAMGASVYARCANDPNYYIKLLNGSPIDSSCSESYKPSFTILSGVSGSGKTTAVESFLRSFPRVIQHTEYGGHQFFTKQIPWIKINFPAKKSDKSFLVLILAEIYRRLEQPVDLVRISRPPIEVLTEQVANLFAIHGIALLAIDNCENLITYSPVAKQETLGSLFNLYEKIGALVLFIGTEEIDTVIGSELRAHRRSLEHQIPRFRALTGADWSRFAEATWKAQYLEDYLPLTDSLKSTLKGISLGLPGLARPIYVAAQIEAIKYGKKKYGGEVITCELLQHVAESAEIKSVRSKLTGSPIKRKETKKSTKQTATPAPTSEKLDPGQRLNVAESDKEILNSIVAISESSSDPISALGELGLKPPIELFGGHL